MKKLLLLLPLLAIGLAACGERKEVPPAYVGKILTPTGYLPDTIPPSSFKLSACWIWEACDKLILINASDQGVTESFTVFMPRNQLTMTFDLRMTASVDINKTDEVLNKIVSQSVEGTDTTRVIGFSAIYEAYAKPIIRDSVRSVVAEYTIDEVASSRDHINAEINDRLRKDLSSTPIGFKTVGLADVTYPEVVTKRKEEAENNRIAIDQEESKKQAKLIKIQTELEAARANRAVRRENAQAAAEENEIAAKSITPEYLEYKRLEVMALMAESGSAVFVPFDALGTVGMSNMVFGGNPNAR